ncbi:MAG: hypothetical protein MI976_24615 [Pseudomonadales bacterium]|nr:hypothetical protein [Pseudomonadales bacterium]
MKVGLIIFSGALIIGVIVYSWFNRDSDRVILTLVTAMTIGALGFITKESISNKVEKFSTEFPVVAFFGLPDYRPINIKLPYEHELSMCLQEVKPEDLPKDNAFIQIGYGSEKYFDAFEYLVIKEIFNRFGQSWNVIAKQTQTPNGKSLSWKSLGDSGEEVLLDNILKKIPENYFVKLGVHANTPAVFGGKAVFPPNTEISVVREEERKSVSILFENRYINLTVKLSQSTSSVGLGEYSRLLGSGQQHINVGDQHQYGNAVYLLSIDLVQTFWLNGHPEMKTHRNWANSIVQLLNNTFNYEQIRDEHLRQYQLYGPGAIRVL